MEKVKIKFEKEIENCHECPFTEYIYEQGFCGICCKFGAYAVVPKEGIRKECPFRVENEENF